MEALIPGLPDDIAQECLIRVAYDHLFTLHFVCRRWREHVRSPYFYHGRRLSGITRHLFLIFQKSLKLNHEPSSDEPDFSLTLFDPISATCRAIPPLPGLLNLYGVQILGVGSQMVAIGRHHPFSISIFNCFTGTWREGASIPGDDSFYFSCESDGVRHVYLLRGSSGIHDYDLKWLMRYDIEEDRWETLTDIPEGNRFYTNGAFHLGKFYLLNQRYNYDHDKSDGKYSCDVYDIVSRKWSLVELIEPITIDGLNNWFTQKHEFAFAPDGRIYCCRQDKNLFVKEGGKWRELANLPDKPPHSLFLCCWKGGVSAIRLKVRDFVHDGVPMSKPPYNVYTYILIFQQKNENLQWTTRNVLPTTGLIENVVRIEI